jgi:hypothetical protein
MILVLARAAARRSSPFARRSFSHHGEHDAAHHHAPHPTFTPPYNKAFVRGMALAIVGVGMGIPLAAVTFQNRKHGFTK